SQDGNEVIGLTYAPGGHTEPTLRPEHPPELAQRAVQMGEEHDTEAAEHAVERPTGKVEVFGVHDAGTSSQPSATGLLVRSLDHALGQIDADRFARHADAIGGWEQYRTAASRHVEHPLPGLDANQGHQTPSEMREGSRSCIVVRDEAIEDRCPRRRMSPIVVAHRNLLAALAIRHGTLYPEPSAGSSRSASDSVRRVPPIVQVCVKETLAGFDAPSMAAANRPGGWPPRAGGRRRARSGRGSAHGHRAAAWRRCRAWSGG